MGSLRLGKQGTYQTFLTYNNDPPMQNPTIEQTTTTDSCITLLGWERGTLNCLFCVLVGLIFNQSIPLAHTTGGYGEAYGLVDLESVRGPLGSDGEYSCSRRTNAIELRVWGIFFVEAHRLNRGMGGTGREREKLGIWFGECVCEWWRWWWWVGHFSIRIGTRR
jgi:hypothetical protein